jgi:hypothetical protein
MVKIEKMVCQSCRYKDCNFYIFPNDKSAVYFNKDGIQTFSDGEDYYTVAKLIKKEGIDNLHILAECNKCEDQTSMTVHFEDGKKIKDPGLAFKKAFI